MTKNEVYVATTNDQEWSLRCITNDLEWSLRCIKMTKNEVYVVPEMI